MSRKRKSVEKSQIFVQQFLEFSFVLLAEFIRQIRGHIGQDPGPGLTSSQGSHLVLLLLSAGNGELDVRNLYGHVHEAPGGGGEGRGDHGSEQSGSEDCDHSERSDGLEQVLPGMDAGMSPPLSPA